MSTLDFSDPAIDRKLSFQIARKGCGLHRERYLCFFNMKNASVLSEDSAKLMSELAKMHYEADFCAGTVAEKNAVVRDSVEDNYYLLDSLSEELCGFLAHKSRIVISENDVSTKGVDVVRNTVVDALKHDRFKRDETTKVAYFKINTSAIQK